jgi:hypothetical protein
MTGQKEDGQVSLTAPPPASKTVSQSHVAPENHYPKLSQPNDRRLVVKSAIVSKHLLCR